MADPGRDLLILGLVRRGPLSAYSVDRAVHGHAALYRALKTGNVYNTLDRLASDGYLISRSAKAARGPRATKTVYRLSAAGERRFHALLRDMLCDVQASDATLEIAYVLLGQLPRGDALQLLRERAAEVAQHERRLHRLYGGFEKRTGAAQLSASHALCKLQAESRFLRDSLELLRDAKWTPAWVSDDGAIVDPARKL